MFFRNLFPGYPRVRTSLAIHAISGKRYFLLAGAKL